MHINPRWRRIATLCRTSEAADQFGRRNAHTMGPRLEQRSIAEFATMSSNDSRALLAVAFDLHAEWRSGTPRRALRGKNLALLCCPLSASGFEAATFQRAGSALGAQVAQLNTGLAELSTPEQIQHTAQLLGRLYDGIDCIGMPADLVRRIGAAAGVPVFEAISSRAHPTRQLADEWAELIEADDRHWTVLQAVLISAIA